MLSGWLLKLLGRYPRAREKAHNRRLRLQTLKQDTKTAEGMGLAGRRD